MLAGPGVLVTAAVLLYFYDRRKKKHLRRKPTSFWFRERNPRIAERRQERERRAELLYGPKPTTDEEGR